MNDEATLSQFWNQKRWDHLYHAHINRFKLLEFHGYCLAACIAYKESLCYGAQEAVERSRA